MNSLNALFNKLNNKEGVNESANTPTTNTNTSSSNILDSLESSVAINREPASNNALTEPAGTIKEASKLNILEQVNIDKVSSSFYESDLTAFSSEEDPIDYMERIENMPSLSEIYTLLTEEQETALNKLSEHQKELLTTVSSTLTRLENELDLKDIDISISAIMERLQENPEIISLVNPNNMRILLNCFSRLYVVKSSVAKAKKEKKATKLSDKQQQYVAMINEDDLDI